MRPGRFCLRESKLNGFLCSPLTRLWARRRRLWWRRPITRIRYGRPDASLTANGWIGGLVATSVGLRFSASRRPRCWSGLVAGALVTFSVEFLEMRLDVDDPGGSDIRACGSGDLGLDGDGNLGRFPGQVPGRFWRRWWVSRRLLGFVFPLTWGLNLLLNRFMPMRVSRGRGAAGDGFV